MLVDWSKVQSEEDLKALGYKIVPTKDGGFEIVPQNVTTSFEQETIEAPLATEQLDLGPIKSFGAGVVQGATFSLTDDLLEGLNLTEQAEALRELEKTHPVAFTAGHITGGVLTPVPGASVVNRGLQLAKLGKNTQNVAKGVATGVISGGLEGLGQNLNPEEALTGATTGAAFGTAIPAAQGIFRVATNVAVPPRIQKAFGKIFEKAKESATETNPTLKIGTTEYADRVTKEADLAIREAMIDIASSIGKTRDDLYNEVRTLADKQKVVVEIDELNKLLANDVDGMLSPERKTTLLKFAKKNLQSVPVTINTKEEALEFLDRAKEKVSSEVDSFVEKQRKQLIKQSVQDAQKLVKNAQSPFDVYKNMVDDWKKQTKFAEGELNTQLISDPTTNKVSILASVVDPKTGEKIDNIFSTNLTAEELSQTFASPKDVVSFQKQLSRQLANERIQTYEELVRSAPNLKDFYIAAKEQMPVAVTKVPSAKGTTETLDVSVETIPPTTPSMSRSVVPFNELLDFQTNLRRIKREANLAPEDIAAFQELDDAINKAIQTQAPKDVQTALERARAFRVRYEGVTDELTAGGEKVKEDPFFALFGTSPAELLSKGQPADLIESGVAKMQNRAGGFSATDPGSAYQKDIQRLNKLISDLKEKGLTNEEELLQRVRNMDEKLQEKFLSDLLTRSGAELQPSLRIFDPLDFVRRVTARGAALAGTVAGKAQHIVDKLADNPLALERQIQRLEAAGRPNAAAFLRQISNRLNQDKNATSRSVKIPVQATTRFIIDQNPGAKDFLNDVEE